jgi:Mlc titration factor MtfA (ptsG expression regulator)
MRGLRKDEEARLRALSERFIGAKQFSGTHGLEISDLMQVEIAAQACILVLELGIEWYEGWSEVIVYPSQFAPSARRWTKRAWSTSPTIRWRARRGSAGR